MADIFDAPRKKGYGVGVQVIVVDDAGAQISSTEHEMYGFSNPDADAVGDDLVGLVKQRVQEYGEMKAGKRSKLTGSKGSKRG